MAISFPEGRLPVLNIVVINLPLFPS